MDRSQGFRTRLHALAPRLRRADAAKILPCADINDMTKENSMLALETLRGNWSYPTSIRFGVGRIAELADACKAVGIKRPLLVTDPGLAAMAMVRDAVAANEKAGVPTSVFSDLRGNPVAKNVEDGIAVLRAGKHDGVIAFGGG